VNEIDAFEILGLTASASEEEINTRLRELAAHTHPDKGGDNAAMATLLFARDTALKAVKNRTVLPVDVIGEFTRVNIEVKKRSEQREITKKLGAEIVHKRTGPYVKSRKVAIAGELVSASVTVVGIKILPLFEIPGQLTNLAAALAVLFAIVFVMASSIVDERKRDVEEILEMFNYRSFYVALIQVINLTLLKQKPWALYQLETLVSAWQRTSSGEPQRIRDLAKKLGKKDFTMLVLSKGIEFGIIREETNLEDEGTLERYTLSSTR
jgi:hypothetical protein